MMGLSPVLDRPTALLPLADSMESRQTSYVRGVRVVARRRNSRNFFMQERMPANSRRQHASGSTVSYVR
jgi:hypothetical protein